MLVSTPNSAEEDSVFPLDENGNKALAAGFAVVESESNGFSVVVAKGDEPKASLPNADPEVGGSLVVVPNAGVPKDDLPKADSEAEDSETAAPNAGLPNAGLPKAGAEAEGSVAATPEPNAAVPKEGLPKADVGIDGSLVEAPNVGLPNAGFPKAVPVVLCSLDAVPELTDGVDNELKENAGDPNEEALKADAFCDCRPLEVLDCSFLRKLKPEVLDDMNGLSDGEDLPCSLFSSFSCSCSTMSFFSKVEGAANGRLEPEVGISLSLDSNFTL